MAEASVESVRLTARSTALINSARRAVWINTWGGDVASKTRLCEIPFGVYLFRGRVGENFRAFLGQNKGVSSEKNSLRESYFAGIS